MKHKKCPMTHSNCNNCGSCMVDISNLQEWRTQDEFTERGWLWCWEREQRSWRV